MSKFQLILLIVFGAFILLAVIVFSVSKSGSSGSATVTIWGDITTNEWNDLANALNLVGDSSLKIQYVEKRSETLMDEHTTALAEDRGPDLIILPLEDLWSQRNRLLPIPYRNMSERDFASTFVEEGELFLSPRGIYALPFTIDPMVLYYNRDLLTRANIVAPLAYWDEIYEQASVLTEKDAAGNIEKSVIALGEATNVPNFKEILSLLLIQAGTPITQLVSAGEGMELRSALSEDQGLPLSPAEAALDFYTQFANPARAYHSWSRSLLPAGTHFAAGDSAYYLGFASDLALLRAKNPTLNLGVAPVPQSRVSDRRVTYGEMKGLAISRGTGNAAAAYTAALKLTSAEASQAISSILLLPPARRDLLAQRQTDSILSVFYESALQSVGWIDPSDEGTASVFREMIESVTSGRARTSEAVRTADEELEALIR